MRGRANLSRSRLWRIRLVQRPHGERIPIGPPCYPSPPRRGWPESPGLPDRETGPDGPSYRGRRRTTLPRTGLADPPLGLRRPPPFPPLRPPAAERAAAGRTGIRRDGHAAPPLRRAPAAGRPTRSLRHLRTIPPAASAILSAAACRDGAGDYPRPPHPPSCRNAQSLPLKPAADQTWPCRTARPPPSRQIPLPAGRAAPLPPPGCISAAFFSAAEPCAAACPSLAAAILSTPPCQPRRRDGAACMRRFISGMMPPMTLSLNARSRLTTPSRRSE